MSDTNASLTDRQITDALEAAGVQWQYVGERDVLMTRGSTDANKIIAALRSLLAPKAAKQAPKVEFEDPRVQLVYELICGCDCPPAGEHWEGWVARRIVHLLRATTPQPNRPAFEAWAKRHHYDLRRCSPEPYADYQDPRTSGAWAGWIGRGE